MWEAEDVPLGNVQWYKLYFTVKFGWVGLKGLMNRKRIWKEVEEIVRRIEKDRRSKRNIDWGLNETRYGLANMVADGLK